MTLIVCLDERGGMRFNNRRQSFDRSVIRRIAGIAEGRKLYISPDSASLFSGVDCIVSQQMQELAQPGDVCFFETGDLSQCLQAAEKLIIFRWNRVYPADTIFPMDSCKKMFSLESTEPFSGYSHDLITQEVYVR